MRYRNDDSQCQWHAWRPPLFHHTTVHKHESIKLHFFLLLLTLLSLTMSFIALIICSQFQTLTHDWEKTYNCIYTDAVKIKQRIICIKIKRDIWIEQSRANASQANQRNGEKKNWIETCLLSFLLTSNVPKPNPGITSPLFITIDGTFAIFPAFLWTTSIWIQFAFIRKFFVRTLLLLPWFWLFLRLRTSLTIYINIMFCVSG